MQENWENAHDAIPDPPVDSKSHTQTGSLQLRRIMVRHHDTSFPQSTYVLLPLRCLLEKACGFQGYDSYFYVFPLGKLPSGRHSQVGPCGRLDSTGVAFMVWDLGV